MYWVLRPWRQMFDFSGRATRREYWLFQAQMLGLYFGFLLLTGMMATRLESAMAGGLLAAMMLVFFLFYFIGSLSAGVRRLHDHDKTGWLFLLSAVPLIGWIFYLIMTLTPGTPGENSYGYDPRDGDKPSADEVAAIFS
jgi:uncharacterized membrane protein YhaH (DUF805 family)